MSEKNSWLAELFARRIPQILGVYIASVWLGVEVSEWMTERFNVPDKTSSYVAVIMISFLPLVALLAWGHGRPGKDKWTQKQLIFIPFNILLAYFAVTTFIQPHQDPVNSQTMTAPVNATKTLSLTDVKTGEVVDYEVAKVGLSQKVVGFFWENTTGDESLDWMRYGAMWLVSKDLARYPIVSIRTPYESNAVYSGLQSKGFDRAVGEPLALNFNIASDLNAQWFIKGRIIKDNKQLGFEVSLYQVNSGEMVASFTSAYADWLVALDEISEKLLTHIVDESRLKLDNNIIPQMSLSQYMSSDKQAIKAVIDSLNSVVFDNDFEQGVAFLETATQLDNQLAEAYVLLMDYYRGLGDLAAAKEAAEKALKLEYNLNKDSLFKLKANYYAVSGDTKNAIKTLENWVKLSPDNTDALSILGNNYLVVGHRLDDALAVYKKLYEMQEYGDTALINLANIYRLNADKSKAVDMLTEYMELNPGKVRPLLELAELHMQFGDLNNAKRYYEEASVLSFNDIKAEIGMNKVKAKEGDIFGALDGLNGVLSKAQTDADRVTVMSEIENLFFLSGQLHNALGLLKEMRQVSQSFMPPLNQNLMFGGKEVAYLAYLGQFDAAWQSFNQMKAITKPPFDEMLGMIKMSIHELAQDHEKAQQTLAEFEIFINQLQIKVYDQFIFDAKARAKRHTGEYDEALKMHDQAIAESQQSIVTLSTMYILDNFSYEKARTLHEAGRFNDSLELIETVIKRNPIYPQALVLKLKGLIATEQLDAAREVVAEVSQIWQQADSDYFEYIEFKNIAAQLK